MKLRFYQEGVITIAETFTCSVCGETFEVEDEWTDKDAIDELHNNFGEDQGVEGCDIVCDDCYDKVKKFIDKYYYKGDT